MKGKLIIVSAPSGSGKTTIVKELLSALPQLAFSVSATNRDKRPNETDGIDYFFMSTDDFQHKINNQEFVEWEEVYPGRFYGTLKSEVDKIWNRGQHVIFDVDVVGGNNLKQQFGDRALSIFIKPPSIDALKERLAKRATETEESFKVRVQKAAKELQYEQYADVVVVNDTLSKAVEQTIELVENFLQI
ncbi:MAG: guanylate kinase [Flavobacteriales bacterium]